MQNNPVTSVASITGGIGEALLAGRQVRRHAAWETAATERGVAAMRGLGRDVVGLIRENTRLSIELANAEARALQAEARADELASFVRGLRVRMEGSSCT